MGDGDLTADAFALTFDSGAFVDAWLQTMADSQVVLPVGNVFMDAWG